MSTKLIEVYKLHNVIYNHLEHSIPLPSDTSFGNMVLKWYDIVTRFDSLNDYIIELDKTHTIVSTSATTPVEEILKSKLLGKEKFAIEQIFYWLRKTADELISLLYLIDYRFSSDEFPTKIKIDSIGTFLNSSDFHSEFLLKYNDLLTTLNDVTNAHKHSITNSEVHSYHGRNEPIAFALSLNRNNSNNNPQFYNVVVNDFISDYCDFLQEIKDLIASFDIEN
ncbi:hypothetical protein [Flavobacterium sp.]|uniref:hypothetical protein n=1 Tax=Flavobacterium sp. TaxID=239 RepID=UPI003D133953